MPKENSDGSGGRVYALVNTTSDPLTQLATTYTADEIAFVKRVLDGIFETYNTSRCEAMVITGVQAIQLAKAGSGDANRRESNGAASQSQGATAQSLSMTQAELVLKRLVEEGWFETSEKGYYSLSPRGLIELRGWLVETYNDEEENDYRANRIKFCAACKDVITVVSYISTPRMKGRNADDVRANAVPTGIVWDACMIYAFAISSECRRQRIVRFARFPGLGISTLASGPSNDTREPIAFH